MTGEGLAQLNGGAGVTPVGLDWSVDAITSTRVRVLGTLVPRRLQYAGSVGFSFSEPDAGSVTRDFVVMERVLNWEYADIALWEFLGNGNQATDIWWRLAPGVSMFLGAYWN